MARKRMTQRRKQAVDGSIPYPGNVNQPNRQFKRDDQYSNYQETLNHPIPDMRHEWQDDERDEIGFGIPEGWDSQPKQAAVRIAANKAVKLAYYLLGNKVSEDIIEDQAVDLIAMGPEALDRSLARFAETGDLYAEDDEDTDDDEEASKDASTEESKEASAEESKESKVAEEESKVAEEESESDDKEEKEASAEESKVAEDDDSDDDDKEEKEASAEEESKEASAEESKVAEDDDSDDDDDDSDSKEASEEVKASDDFELSGLYTDESSEADPRLAGLFEDDIPEELPQSREASEKEGVKTLGGGQPRVAGNAGEAQDLSNIWGDAPDITGVFN